MQNIFKQLDANAPSHMNAFDLSQRHIMSTKVGLKNVVCAIDTMPKDYFECDVLSLVRSMPINTAAFSRMKVNFEAVFVPYQQLWHGWNQFYLQTEERMSVGDSFDHTQLPRVPVESLLHILYDCAVYDGFLKSLNSYISDNPRLLDKYTNETNVLETIAFRMFNTPGIVDGYLSYDDLFDEMGYSRGWNMVRLFDQLGYFSAYSVYQGAINDVYRQLADAEEVIEYNADGSVNISSTAGRFAEAFSSAFDHMPYLDILRLGSQGADVMKEDLQQDNIDFFSFERQFAFAADYTDEGDYYHFKVREQYFNMFRALAYQKAYQDYTLNKRQESYDPSYFNVDSYDVVDNYSILCKIFTFRYESWDYDLFTGVFNSPQTGDVSILNNNVSLSFKPNSSVGEGRKQLVVGGPASAGTNMPVSLYDGQTGTFVSEPPISVYDIKRAEFLQRWKENHLRAGNKLQNQALGQWNTKFRYLSDEYSDYIGSWEMPINIDEVINTADNQGDISGKGIGTSNGSFKYRTNDAGVILIMVSIKPRAEYDALMVDRQNTCLEIGDFPSPFFDNLGFESVPRYLLSMNCVPSERSLSLGYTVRYASWKTAIDKVHGSFMSYGYTPDNNGAGSLAIWATPRRELESIRQLSDITRIFYVNPNVVDSIFGVASDSSIESDHFNLNVNVICKVIRNLSVSGQLMFGL